MIIDYKIGGFIMKQKILLVVIINLILSFSEKINALDDIWDYAEFANGSDLFSPIDKGSLESGIIAQVKVYSNPIVNTYQNKFYNLQRLYAKINNEFVKQRVKANRGSISMRSVELDYNNQIDFVFNSAQNLLAQVNNARNNNRTGSIKKEFDNLLARINSFINQYGPQPISPEWADYNS